MALQEAGALAGSIHQAIVIRQGTPQQRLVCQRMAQSSSVNIKFTVNETRSDSLVHEN